MRWADSLLAAWPGLMGMVTGFGGLVGFQGWGVMGQSWKGLGERVVVLSPGGVALMGLNEVTGMGKSLVAWDRWSKDPAQAAGESVFTIATFFIPVGGAAAGTAKAVSLAGKAAEVVGVAGKVAKVADVLKVSRVADVVAGVRVTLDVHLNNAAAVLHTVLGGPDRTWRCPAGFDCTCPGRRCRTPRTCTSPRSTRTPLLLTTARGRLRRTVVGLLLTGRVQVEHQVSPHRQLRRSTHFCATPPVPSRQLRGTPWRPSATGCATASRTSSTTPARLGSAHRVTTHSTKRHPSSTSTNSAQERTFSMGRPTGSRRVQSRMGAPRLERRHTSLCAKARRLSVADRLGANFFRRSQPPSRSVLHPVNALGQGDHVYEVAKSVPVVRSVVERAFEDPGGGFQYHLDGPLSWLPGSGQWAPLERGVVCDHGSRLCVKNGRRRPESRLCRHGCADRGGRLTEQRYRHRSGGRRFGTLDGFFHGEGDDRRPAVLRQRDGRM